MENYAKRCSNMYPKHDIRRDLNIQRCISNFDNVAKYGNPVKKEVIGIEERELFGNPETDIGKLLNGSNEFRADSKH